METIIYQDTKHIKTTQSVHTVTFPLKTVPVEMWVLRSHEDEGGMEMNSKGFTEKQIIRVLKEAEGAEGQRPVPPARHLRGQTITGGSPSTAGWSSQSPGD